MTCVEIIVFMNGLGGLFFSQSVLSLAVFLEF